MLHNRLGCNCTNFRLRSLFTLLFTSSLVILLFTLTFFYKLRAQPLPPSQISVVKCNLSSPRIVRRQCLQPKNIYRFVSSERLSSDVNRALTFLEDSEAQFINSTGFNTYLRFINDTYDTVVTHRHAIADIQTTNKVALIVEPRDHPLLEYTIRSTMMTIGCSWALQIVYSDVSEPLVNHIVRGYESQPIILSSLADFGYTARGGIHNSTQYSFLLTSKEFWSKVAAEHVLVFQTDVLMLRPIPNSLLKYAYIGAAWDWDFDEPGESICAEMLLNAPHSLSSTHAVHDLCSLLDLRWCVHSTLASFRCW